MLDAPDAIDRWGAAETLLLLVALAGGFAALRATVGSRFASAMALVGIAGFLFERHPGIAAGVAATGIVALVARGRLGLKPPVTRDALREFGFVGGGLTLYEIGRMLSEASYAPAVTNAREVVAFERSLHLFFEPHAQDLALRSEAVTHVFNGIYAFGFLSATVAALTWLFLTDRSAYVMLRNALALSTVLALITIAAFPAAPPRLMPEVGILDTADLFGAPREFANSYASVPSLHVGWIFLAGFVLWKSVNHPAAVVFAVVPGMIMGIAVIATGNHYWFDGVVGAAYALVPLALMTARQRRGVEALAVRSSGVAEGPP